MHVIVMYMHFILFFFYTTPEFKASQCGQFNQNVSATYDIVLDMCWQTLTVVEYISYPK